MSASSGRQTAGGPQPAMSVGAAIASRGETLSSEDVEQLRFDNLVGWFSVPLNVWYILKLAPQMSTSHVLQMVWFNMPVFLFMCVWAPRWPRSYLRHRTLLQCLARLNGFFVPVVSSREALEATIHEHVGWANTAPTLFLATRTWLLFYVPFSNRVPLGPHLATQAASWAVLCLRARRNFCQSQILSSPALLGAAGKLHVVASTLATAIAPMTAALPPRQPQPSCEAALLFVWTLGLLIPSAMLASGSAAAAAGPARRGAGARTLAALDSWLGQLRAPQRPSLHNTPMWCLRWLLVLVCVWVACCVAVDALP